MAKEFLIDFLDTSIHSNDFLNKRSSVFFCLQIDYPLSWIGNKDKHPLYKLFL